VSGPMEATRPIVLVPVTSGVGRYEGLAPEYTSRMYETIGAARTRTTMLPGVGVA
jgi:hypothetical protein